MDNTKWTTTISPEDMEKLGMIEDTHTGSFDLHTVGGGCITFKDYPTNADKKFESMGDFLDATPTLTEEDLRELGEANKALLDDPEFMEDTMPVHLAWYHDGYTDNSPDLLGVCVHPRRALRLLKEHKDTRDATYEYKDQARWWIEEKELLCGLG